MMKPEKLDLVSEWDKTFPKSKSVNHKKVAFVNRYGITLAVDMYNHSEEISRPCSLWTFWCGKGAMFRSVCSNDGRTRIFDHRV